MGALFNKILLVFSTSFFYCIKSSQIETKIKEEDKNVVDINLLLNQLQDYKIKKIFEYSFNLQINQDLQNIILSYLKEYKCLGEYVENDRHRLLDAAKTAVLEKSFFTCYINLPNGIQATCNSKIIKIIDADNRVLKILFGHNDKITSMIYLPNDYLASGDSRIVNIWNINTWEIEKTLKVGSPSLCLLPMENNFLAIGSDQTIEFWNIKTFQLEGTLKIDLPADLLIYLANETILVFTAFFAQQKYHLIAYKPLFNLIDDRLNEIQQKNLDTGCSKCCAIQ